MKNIAKLSEHIDGLAESKRLAEQQLDSAIGTLAIAHAQLVKVSEHIANLTGEGRATGALAELAEYAAVAREVTAEATLALSGLRPGHPVIIGAKAKTATAVAIVDDARNGMQGKRLAKWESDALREAVVAALAGEETP